MRGAAEARFGKGLEHVLHIAHRFAIDLADDHVTQAFVTYCSLSGNHGGEADHSVVIFLVFFRIAEGIEVIQRSVRLPIFSIGFE